MRISTPWVAVPCVLLALGTAFVIQGVHSDPNAIVQEAIVVKLSSQEREGGWYFWLVNAPLQRLWREAGYFLFGTCAGVFLGALGISRLNLGTNRLEGAAAPETAERGPG